MSYSYYEVYTNAQRAFSGLGFPYGADEDAAYLRGGEVISMMNLDAANDGYAADVGGGQLGDVAGVTHTGVGQGPSVQMYAGRLLPAGGSAAGGDGTDYSNVCYKANHSIYKSSTPASINNMPSWQWRVINEDGYILMAMPDYSTSFQRLDIRILDGTNGQVGSTINVDFPVEHSNKKDNVHYGLREDTIWTELYSGSNTS